MEELREYQKRIVNFIKHRDRCCVSASAGLGKTRCAIEYLDPSDYHLVIAPAHLREQWKQEILKWKPELADKVEIKSYDFFSRRTKYPAQLTKVATVVCDEAHYLKSQSAKRTQHITNLVLSKIKKHVFLTATPIKKSSADLFTMMNAFYPGKWSSFDDFGSEFCNQVWDPFKKEYVYAGVRPDKVEILKNLWDEHAIKMTKEDVASELPPVMEQVVYLTGEEGAEDRVVDLSHITEEIKSEYQHTGIAKIPAIVDFIDSNPMEPTLIFTHHRKVADTYVRELRKLDISVDCILGGDTKKQTKVDAFQAGNTDILVINMEAGGTGLNLQRASRVMFAEIPWTYTDYYQCFNRAHRINTKHTVMVWLFLQRGTLDPAIFATIKEKKNTNDIIIGELYDGQLTAKKQAKRISENKGAENSEHTRNISNGKRTGRINDDVGFDPLGISLTSIIPDPLGIGLFHSGTSTSYGTVILDLGQGHDLSIRDSEHQPVSRPEKKGNTEQSTRDTGSIGSSFLDELCRSTISN
jgi:SNF2 family DNA or RNA helicase